MDTDLGFFLVIFRVGAESGQDYMSQEVEGTYQWPTYVGSLNVVIPVEYLEKGRDIY